MSPNNIVGIAEIGEVLMPLAGHAGLTI